MCIFINSCMSNKTIAFLNQCNEKAQNTDDKYCLTTISDIKDSLSGGRPLFYIGSDNTFHYFVYAYDKTVKISAKLKINKNEFTPKYNQFAKDDSNIVYNFPVYLSDL